MVSHWNGNEFFDREQIRIMGQQISLSLHLLEKPASFLTCLPDSHIFQYSKIYSCNDIFLSSLIRILFFFFFVFFLRFILFVEETEWQRWGCQKKHFASAGSLPRSLSVHDWLGRGQEPGTPRSLSEWQEPQYLDHLLCSPKAPQQEAVL